MFQLYAVALLIVLVQMIVLVQIEYVDALDVVWSVVFLLQLFHDKFPLVFVLDIFDVVVVVVLQY